MISHGSVRGLGGRGGVRMWLLRIAKPCGAWAQKETCELQVAILLFKIVSPLWLSGAL